MSNKIDTGMKDDNGVMICLGDTLKCKDGYSVVVCEDKLLHNYFGKLVCHPLHPCANIPYSLNNGKGYIISLVRL